MYYLILILVFFSSVGFFNYHGILSDQMQRGLFYAVSCVALFFAVTERKIRLNTIEYPRYSYWIVIGSIFISILMVNIYHGQPIYQSVIATLPYVFSYLLFFVLLKYQLSEAVIIKIFMVLSLMALPVYFCNLLSFPVQVFGIENSEGADFTRGMLRVAIPFFEMMVFMLFYAIQKWKSTKHKVWLCWIAMMSLMVFLSVTRQVILVAMMLALIMVIKDFSLIRKVLAILMIVALGVVILPKISVFNTMVELSEAQAELNDDKEDIRIRAWRYYTYENQDAIETVLLGNGVAAYGITKYGIQFQQDTEESKCYLVDVGWAGFFYTFGLVGTIALLAFLLNGVKNAWLNGKEYVSFWLIYIIITSIASGPILFYYQIVIIMTVMYLAYSNNEEDGTDNTELQQC